MPAANLGIDHEYTTRETISDCARRLGNTKGGGRARDVHVKCIPFDAERALDFDSNRWIGALQVGARYDYGINI